MIFAAGRTTSVLQMYELVRTRMMELSEATPGATACLVSNNLPFQSQGPGLAFSNHCRPEGISFILPPCPRDPIQHLQEPIKGRSMSPGLFASKSNMLENRNLSASERLERR